MSGDHHPPEAISARLVSLPADADRLRINDYDGFAEAYAAANENNFVNAWYERPAMLALAGEVAGRRMLDAGCGAGPLLAALRDRGASVAGFDRSAVMVELARQRLGDHADLRVAELGRPLPYPDGTFDDVTASLVLHYLEDWGPGRFWNRPLHAMTDAFSAAGLQLATISEPAVAPETPRDLLPADLPHHRRCLAFLFFVLHAS